MDKQSTVVFRNVGQLYFPQTRVECHYSLTSDHQWSSSDWIGIFEAFYLPRPSAVEYQFVYVDKMGKVCARSRPFTFHAPKPLEELETLKEDQDEEDGEEELLLVIPRAQLLQSRLEECLKKQTDIQQALDVAKKEVVNEKENSRKARLEWEREREAMKEEISELRDKLRNSCEMLTRMEGKHKNVKYSQENLTSELSKLMAEKAECQQRNKELEEDLKALKEREKEENGDLERLKERVKKMSTQMKHDEEKRKCLQEENEAALAQAQGLQERLEACEHEAEGLRRELRELGTRHGHTNTELHQARLQVAQLTLQLSEENLVLREERANWALEREACKHAAETDKKKMQDLSCEVEQRQEWLQEERMEREKLELELGRERDCSRDLLNFIRQLEQRLEIVPESTSNGEIPTCISSGSSSEDDEEASPPSPRSIRSPLFLSAHLERPNRAETIAAETHSQNKEDTPASDTQDLRRQHCEPRACEGKQLILPELTDPILRDWADCPMW